MSVHFTKIKLCWPRSLRAVAHSCLDRFPPVGRRFVGRGSCRAQSHQSFQIPTDTFELQFQTIARLPQISYSPITGAPLPPGKHGFNLTPDRTEQTVRPHRRRAQLLPTAGLAQNPVGHAVFPAPFAPGFTPIRLVGHDHFLVAVFTAGSMIHIAAPILVTGEKARLRMPANMAVISIIRNTAKVMPISRAKNLPRSLTSSLKPIRRMPLYLILKIICAVCSGGFLPDKDIHHLAGIDRSILFLKPENHREHAQVHLLLFFIGQFNLGRDVWLHPDKL